MHVTAMRNCKQFFAVYADAFRGTSTNVVDIGSQDINGSLRSCCPKGFKYIGVDFIPGKGVDVVLQDPYKLPFESQSIDIVLSSSCFEHCEMFWVLFLEIIRVLKPHGLFYLNAPSNGDFHRYPVDCWRFYPDSGRALVVWAKRNGLNPVLLESYVSMQIDEHWNDYVAIFASDADHGNQFAGRVLSRKTDFYNGLVIGNENFLNYSALSEDRKKFTTINKIIEDNIKIAASSS